MGQITTYKSPDTKAKLKVEDSTSFGMPSQVVSYKSPKRSLSLVTRTKGSVWTIAEKNMQTGERRTMDYLNYSQEDTKKAKVLARLVRMSARIR